MIQINGTIRLQGGSADKAKDAIVTMMLASRQEDGCIDYTFAQDLNDPAVLVLFERWRDQDALQAHMQSAHMADFQKAMEANPPAMRQLRMYETDEGQPI